MGMGKTFVVYFQTQLTLDLLLYILIVFVLAVLFDAKSTKNFGPALDFLTVPFRFQRRITLYWLYEITHAREQSTYLSS